MLNKLKMKSKLNLKRIRHNKHMDNNMLKPTEVSISHRCFLKKPQIILKKNKKNQKIRTRIKIKKMKIFFQNSEPP